jgi:Tol biopolymer transport system component
LKVADPATGGYAEWPVLSPDMTQVAYAYAGPDTKWNYQVRIAALRPDAPARPLGRAYAYMYVHAWAPDGKSVLATNFSEHEDTELTWLSTIDGSSRVLRTSNWQVGRAALSPDGRFIAYHVHREPGKPESQILVLASDGSSETIVAPAPGVNESPIWSKDGSRLLFKSDRSGSFGIWSIAMKNGRGDGAPSRLKADSGDIDLIGFTTTSLLYAHRSGTTDVYMKALDGPAGTVHGDAVRLVDTHLGSNISPAASPDQKFLAYHRRVGAANQWSNLVIRSLETGSERVVPSAFRYAGLPMWLPDGSGIVQIARNPKEQHRDLQGGSEEQPGRRGGQRGRPWAGSGAVAGRAHRVHILEARRRRQRPGDPASRRSRDRHHEGAAARRQPPRSCRQPRRPLDRDSDVGRRQHASTPDDVGCRCRWPQQAADSLDQPARRIAGSRYEVERRQRVHLLPARPAQYLVADPCRRGAPVQVGELGRIPARTIDLTRDGRQVIFGTDSGFTVEIWALENVPLPVPPTRP